MIENDSAFRSLLEAYDRAENKDIISKARDLGLLHINDSLFAISKNPVSVKADFPLTVGITGLSGAGKDTIACELITHGGFELVKSHTTREKRERDIDSPYIYISREEFEDKIKKGDFIEFFLRGTDYMGLERDAIDTVLKNGNIPIIRTGPEAIGKLPNLLSDLSIVSFFVIPESWRDLQKRLVARDVVNCFQEQRSEARNDIRTRLKRNRELLNYIPNANFLLINRYGKITEAVGNIETVIKSTGFWFENLPKES
jgi:guanylate kinase